MRRHPVEDGEGETRYPSIFMVPCCVQVRSAAAAYDRLLKTRWEGALKFDKSPMHILGDRVGNSSQMNHQKTSENALTFSPMKFLFISTNKIIENTCEKRVN